MQTTFRIRCILWGGIVDRAAATNVIAEGEVLQLMNMHDPDIAVSEYLRVIRFKTAKLFEASARLGAVLADASSDVEEACAAYGRSLGTAFQLVDDLLDYEGNTAELGKNVGDDLREGKPTLPLLIAMERGTAAERELIRHAIEHGEVARLASFDHSQVSRVAYELVQMGLATQQDDPVDRRKQLLALTAVGIETLRKGIPGSIEREKRLRGRLTKAEYEVFCRVLQVLGEESRTMLRQGDRGGEGGAGRTRRSDTRVQ